MRLRVLDRGREEIILYPEEWQTSRSGVKLKVPSDIGVTVPCTAAEERQSTAELPGQVDNKVTRINCRIVEGVGSNSRAFFRGEEWDIAAPPTISRGHSKALDHMELILRGRNKLGGGNA